MVMNETIDVSGMLEGVGLQDIPIDKCVTGIAEARQAGTEVKKDDKLVVSIRKLHGIIHPVILHDLKNGQYEIVNGLRRYHAFNQLNKKHPSEGWDKIPAIIGDQPNF